MTSAPVGGGDAMSLPARFQRHLATAPDALALSSPDEAWSYAEVDAWADRLVALLVSGGVSHGGLVGLSATRGTHVAVGILAVLRHGAGYVPLDPTHPPARTDLVVARAGLTWLLEEDADQPDGFRLVRLDRGHQPVAVPPDTAYVIFTSGSTGEPKGVVVTHEQVGAMLDATAELIEPRPDDVWSMTHSHCFDMSVWELWGAWNSGARVLAAPRAYVGNALPLAELLAAQGITILSLVPTGFHHLTQALRRRPRDLPALRTVVLGGEAIHLPVIAQWHSLGHTKASVVNMYGITEITVHATWCDVSPATPTLPGTTPIGVPLAHLDIRLLDADGREVAVGEPGEIVVSGSSVAGGYLGRDELTRERFGRDAAGRRTYRSGDFAIRDDQGALHFIGRRDDQVQCRGYRIELGEVASVVERHPRVSVCVVRMEDDGRAAKLVAHCVLDDPNAFDNEPETVEDIRSHAATYLPAYMVPHRIHLHSELPSTSNGKVDLDRLSSASAASPAPRPA